MNLDTMIKENNRLVDIRNGIGEEMKAMRDNFENFSDEYDELVEKWAEFDNVIVKHQHKLYQTLLEESFKSDKEWTQSVYNQIKR